MSGFGAGVEAVSGILCDRWVLLVSVVRGDAFMRGPCLLANAIRVRPLVVRPGSTVA